MLVALVPTRAGIRAVAIVGGAAALTALAALALPGIQTVDGASGEGAVMIAILVALGAIAALSRAVAAMGPSGSLDRWATGALIVLLAATVIAAASGGTGPASSTEAGRLISAQSNRSAYGASPPRCSLRTR